MKSKRRLLPELEKSIGVRLRKFRDHHVIARTAMARELKCGASLYDACEGGRSPLKMAVFLALYERFNLSPRWLFTGKSSAEDEHFFLEKVRAQIEPKENFSACYPRLIAPLYEGHAERAALQRAGALKTLKAFVAEAEAGRMGATAIVSVAAQAVSQWALIPGGKRPPRLACHVIDLYDQTAAEHSDRRAAAAHDA